MADAGESYAEILALQIGRAATLSQRMGEPVRREARSDSGRTPGVHQPFDYVVTVCNNACDACPGFPAGN